MNFKLIKKGVDVSIVRDELNAYLKLHKWSKKRATAIQVQMNTEDISLRHALIVKSQIKKSKKSILGIAADTEYHSINKETYPYFQKTYTYLENFATNIGGQLTRVMIVNLKPKTKVLPHIDEGNYYLNKDRYHLVVMTTGSVNICDGEKQIYKEGELWWFDNKKIHEAENISDHERIHIIFDILMEKRSIVRKCKDYLEKKFALAMLN